MKLDVLFYFFDSNFFGIAEKVPAGRFRPTQRSLIRKQSARPPCGPFLYYINRKETRLFGLFGRKKRCRCSQLLIRPSSLCATIPLL